MRLKAFCACLGFLVLGCDSQPDPPAPMAEESREHFWKLRYSLKPLLEREASIETGWVARPFLAGLVVTYVIDRVGQLERVTTDHLQRWGIDEERLHQESLASFTAPFLVEEAGLEFRVFSAGREPFLAAPAGESTFASSLVLSPAFQVGVEEIFGTWEGLWVALPSRSSCRILRPPDPANLERLRAEFLRDHQSASHPLLRHFLVTETGGGFALGLEF